MGRELADNVFVIDNRVASVDDYLKDIDNRVKAVDDKIAAVNGVEYIFYPSS